MFALKALLMIVFPFYRVSLPLNIIIGSGTYEQYDHGKLVRRANLDANNATYIELKKYLSKQQTGWKYDLDTYVPNRTFLFPNARINCLGDGIVVN